MYHEEGKDDIVWQQKQKTRATLDDDVELSVLSSSLNNTNNNSRDDTNNDNDDDDDDDDEGPPVDIEYFDEILYEESKAGYYKAKMGNALKEKKELLGKKINIVNNFPFGHSFTLTGSTSNIDLLS